MANTRVCPTSSCPTCRGARWRNMCRSIVRSPCKRRCTICRRLRQRSIIYSLGVTLYYLLAGSPPFKAESSIAVALMHVHEAPPVLGLMRADITPQIDFVMSKVLSKWPQDRFQTGSAFCAAFAAAIEASEDARRFSFTGELLAKDRLDSEASGYNTQKV